MKGTENNQNVDNALCLFKQAYENRYTWEPGFKGYKGQCAWVGKDKLIEGEFMISNDLKPKVQGIDDENIQKLIASQLWEVAIHRVRRSFNDIHGENTFKAGNSDEIGLEIIVGGKNKGDKYRVKDNIVTMVHRHIHGSLINIFTNKVVHTGEGYLSNLYSSQYLDPITSKPLKGKSFFEDKFIPLFDGGPWVLSKRSIENHSLEDKILSKDEFNFFNLKSMI